MFDWQLASVRVLWDCQLFGIEFNCGTVNYLVLSIELWDCQLFGSNALNCGTVHFQSMQ